MQSSGIDLKEYCDLLSTILIKNDCETLKDIAPLMNQPIVSLGLLPYCALFCSSFKEFISLDSFDEESIYNISDIRNKLKLFDDRYGRDKKRILSLDANQDNEFKSKVRFKLLSNLNLHYNLGVYLDSDEHIIGNTQHIFYMFQDSHISHIKIDKREIKKSGKDIGTIIASVSKGLKKFPVEIHTGLSYPQIEVKHKDFNTNRNFNSFPEIVEGKEITLRTLHILSSLNFIRYVLDKIVPNNNMWAMRIKYIAMYYASKSIEHLLVKLPEKYSEVFKNRNTNLLNGTFRSCMMHYSFFNKGVCAIKEEYLDLHTMLFGLVESCFGGIHYDELIAKIDKEIEFLATGLENILNIDLSGNKILD